MSVLTSKYIFDSSLILNSQKILRKMNCAVFHKNRTWKKYSNNASLLKTNEKVSETNNNSSNISDSLVKWAVQNNITHSTFTKLLRVLREYGIKDLPVTSAAMLLAKEAKVKVVKMLPGIYTHFGFKKNLLKLMETLIEKNIFTGTDISVSIFVDEVPDLKTINQNLWVILGSVEGFMNNVFFIGAYLGFSKPRESNLFLSEFVQEAIQLTTEGLKINDIKYNVKIKRLICDSPAKGFVLNIKNFSGYSSCTKCHVTGDYENKRVCFIEKGTPRKDTDFEKNEIYHKSEKTCLLKLPNFGVVSNVTIDYMHLVCLGVVKKLLSFWLRDEYFWTDKKYAFSKFKSLPLALPCEFHTKNKNFNLDNLHSAYDLRNFLLYYGPFILKDALNKPYYKNFLNLHRACRLLCTEASVEFIYLGKQLLDNFIEEYKTLYKPENMTYNIHGLYHLADDCYSHGILDNFSSFPFEKFLFKLKNTMQRNRKKIIPQTILKESYEKIFESSLENLSCYNVLVKNRVVSEIYEFENFHQFDKIHLKNYQIISSSQNDNHVFLKDGKIIKVTGIYKDKTENNYFIAGNEFLSSCNFHFGKFRHLNLGTFIINKHSGLVKKWPVDFLDTKGMVLPMENDSLLIIKFLDNNF